jgi:hypothetical protein
MVVLACHVGEPRVANVGGCANIPGFGPPTILRVISRERTADSGPYFSSILHNFDFPISFHW